MVRSSRPRGALPEAFESGAASLRSSTGCEVRGSRGGGFGGVREGALKADAVPRRPLATVGSGFPPPGFCAFEGAFPGFGGGLARPGFPKPGSARKRLSSPPRWRSEARGQDQGAAREVRSARLSGSRPFPYPSRARASERGSGLPHPLGVVGHRAGSSPRARKAAGTKRRGGPPPALPPQAGRSPKTRLKIVSTCLKW